jgi:DEAD/DEAH box helicase domain-containing protein
MDRAGRDETLVFDLETKYLAQEIGGWSQIRRMGMSVGVTYSVEDCGFRVYLEEEAEALVRSLLGAHLVIGYNILRFDYEVLHGYTFHDLREDVPTLDLMVVLAQILGFRPKLQDLAVATLGVSKLGDGLDAVRWYREGNMRDLIAYCQQDVQVTHDLYNFGAQNGFVLLQGRYGVQRVRVDW